MSNQQEYRLLLPCQQEQHWKKIQSKLEESSFPQTIEDFVIFLNCFNSEADEAPQQFGTLVKFLSEEYKNTGHFFKQVLPSLAEEAL